MDKTMENTVNKLKELIDKNGSDYLSNEPYLVYKELIASELRDEKTAGAIMLALVRGTDRAIGGHDKPESLSKQIQTECCFNKKMADRVAEIFLTLYSDRNNDEWNARKLEGWTQFQKSKFCGTWNGFSVWQTGGGSVDCHFKAEIVLKPAESIIADEKLSGALDDNPFMTKEAIAEYYTKKIREHL